MFGDFNVCYRFKLIYVWYIILECSYRNETNSVTNRQTSGSLGSYNSNNCSDKIMEVKLLSLGTYEKATDQPSDGLTNRTERPTNRQAGEFIGKL